MSTEIIGEATSAKRTLARFHDVLGAAPQAVQPKSLMDYLREIKAKAPPDVSDGAGTFVGAAAGAIGWKAHRVLGGIAGASLGRNLPALLRAHERKIALANMSVTASGLFGSLSLPKHPVLGFVLGWLTAGALTAGLRK